MATNSVEVKHFSVNVPYKKVDNPIHFDIDSNFDEIGRLNEQNNNEVIPARTASLSSCFFNLTNTIIGSGILALPFAFSKTGYLLGTFFLILFGASSAFSLHILSLAAIKCGLPASFYSVAEKNMPKFSTLIDIAVALKCFGVSISYLVVIGDLMPEVISYFTTSLFWKQRTLWVIFGFSIAAPLSCLKTLHSLRYASVISIIFVFYLILLVIYYAIYPNCDTMNNDENSNYHQHSTHSSQSTCGGEIKSFIIDFNTLQYLPIFVYSYTCQHNIFSVVNEIKSLSMLRVNTVILLSICLSCALYLIIGTVGYTAYGNTIDSNILLNYPSKLSLYTYIS
jgi:amino acid permease